ncbi:MAG: hypothetical protein IAE63_06815 [Alphaproteobacteria bacterium]|nr:hypothetical protein [Alphaproteobacteria bacterium]
MDAKQILKRSERSWTVKNLWKTILEEAYELACPGVNPYVASKKNPRVQDKLFDSTAVSSTLRLTNRYFNEITPPSGEMATLEVGPLLEMQVGKDKAVEVNKQLEMVNDIVVMMFQTISFAGSVWSAWLDYVIAGMGVMLMLENVKDDLEPFLFEAVSQSEVAIEEGVGGAVNALSRKRSIRVSQIKELWDDAKVPSMLQKKSKDDPEVDVLEYCYLKDRVWSYVVIYADNNNPEIMVEREYSTCPFIVWRSMKISGSAYGLSRVLMALPDIRTANKSKEMVLKNAALALAGMYLAADDGVLNVDTIQITNGGIIPVARTGGSLGASIAPLETGRSFDVGQLVLEELRTQIKKALLDNQLPPLNGKVRSATEFIERQKELAEDIGGELPRLLMELVVPLYRRAIDIGSRRGMIPNLKIDQFALKVTVKTPLARGQDVQEVEKIVQWWQILTMLLGPQMAMAAVKMPDIVPYVSRMIGIPSDLYNNKTENEALQNQVVQLVAAQQAQQVQNSIPQQA